MGEFNVSAGEQLLVNPGKSGRATQYNYQANGGTTTCIGTGTLTTNEISVSANGGTGGSQSSPGYGATTKSVSGSRPISGTNVTANGGAGGSGSTASFGFGPEGYGAGGGGAAGFVLATEEVVPTCLIMEATHHSVEVEEPWVATAEAHGLLVKLRQTTRITGHQQVLVLGKMVRTEAVSQQLLKEVMEGLELLAVKSKPSTVAII